MFSNVYTGENKVLKVVKSTTNELKKLSQKKMEATKRLPEFELSFGEELTKIALEYYVKGRKNKPKAMLANFAPKDNLHPNLHPKQEEGTFKNEFNIDWTMKDIKAANAFRAQSFEVAHVNSNEVLEQLKESAAKSIEEGESYNKWRESMRLEGFDAENPYNLRTNFNTAVSGSQLAGEWQNFEDQKSIFPYLEYVSLTDDRVREDHLELNGTVRPVDDPFWNEKYPPNDWNCRCFAVPLTNEEGASKANKPIPKVEINKDFNKNVGKTLKIWGKWLDSKKIENYSYDDIALKSVEKLKSNQEPLKIENPSEYLKKELSGVKIDINEVPIYIKNNISLNNIQYIESTLATPNEIWFDKNLNHFVYFKKFKEKNIIINTKNGIFQRCYSTKNADSKRKGILVYTS